MEVEQQEMLQIQLNESQGTIEELQRKVTTLTQAYGLIGCKTSLALIRGRLGVWWWWWCVAAGGGAGVGASEGGHGQQHHEGDHGREDRHAGASVACAMAGSRTMT